MSGGARPPVRQLIVNADDLGLSPLVNEGIEEAVRAGVVTSASLMVNTPGFDDAVGRARALAGRISVGLHFNLTTGKAVAPAGRVPSLHDGTGRFLPLSRLIRRALLGGVRPEDVRREAEAQFSRLREVGITPTHADSHRHVHAFPSMRGAFAAAAAAAGVTLVRRPLEPLLAPPAGVPGLAKRALLIASWAVPSRGARPTPGTDAFRGITLLGSETFTDDLLALIDALPEGRTELMVHPGRSDPSVAAWDPYIEGRAVELAALLSPGVRERLARGDPVLSRFGA